MSNQENAKLLIDAIKKIASDQNTLDNFQCYLERHFSTWFYKYVTDPDGLVNEFTTFSNIK